MMKKKKKDIFACPICLDESVPIQCEMIVSQYCPHTICRTCAENYIHHVIGEMWKTTDYVNPFRCPLPNCPFSIEIEPTVMDILKQSRYKKDMAAFQDWLKERSNPRARFLAFCPRKHCRSKTGSGTMRYVSHNEEEKMVYCEACRVRYCEMCLYRCPDDCMHHECTSLPPMAVCVLCVNYAEATPMERAIENKWDKYRPWLPHYAVSRFSEWGGDTLFLYWMKTARAMACPECLVVIEKNGGCNHMTCLKCGCHFCYACGRSMSNDWCDCS